MKKLTFFLALLFSFLATNISATTWDEPWADEVIKEADYFILADIVSYDNEKGVKVKIKKQLGGDKLPAKIEITNFYLLDIASKSSGHGPGFSYLKKITQSYFFLKKNKKGEFCIATPTTGFDFVEKGNVYSTYRHSYHQALVPIDIYELSMSAIFNNYHDKTYDRSKIINFIDSQLAKQPAGFEKEEINTFFLQHVALESIYHLKIDGFFNKIIPFLDDSTNFHNRVAAARALRAYNTPETKKVLLNKIAHNNGDDFVTVICIWTLTEFKPTELKEDLEKLEGKASTEDCFFESNIMDPRVATHFPNVKSALSKLLSKL